VAADGASRWRVLLDGKPIRTPKLAVLELPTRSAASLVATEWAIQETYVNADLMPLTSLATTCTDLTAHQIPDKLDEVIGYLRTDTICFLDAKHKVAAEQERSYASIWDWFERTYGYRLSVASGDIMCVPEHPPELIPAVKARLANVDQWTLTALGIAAGNCRSSALALALLAGEVSAAECQRLAQIEEDMQIHSWGLVEGEHDVAQNYQRLWLEACKVFHDVTRTEAPGLAGASPPS
jgi:chaperone required for assembly of F1-ATPase